MHVFGTDNSKSQQLFWAMDVTGSISPLLLSNFLTGKDAEGLWSRNER